MAKAAVVVFPGSNCDQDAVRALASIQGERPLLLWHKETEIPQGVRLVVLPGGFSYGDYLRSGAMAARSPIMQAVHQHVNKGGFVLGICNGFQILTEASLLEGALLCNVKRKFLGRDVFIRTEDTATPFTVKSKAGEVTQIPIAHHDGQFYADRQTLALLQQEGRILFRYCSRDGQTQGEDINPNGSLDHIAGITNKMRTVFGMMPHPERPLFHQHGIASGSSFLEGLCQAL